MQISLIDLRRNSIFFKASLLALVYERIENKNLFIKIKNNLYFQRIIGALIVLISYIMIRKFSNFYNPYSTTWALLAGGKHKGVLQYEYYSLFLFIIILIGAPNPITNFLESKALTELGK